ncbi:hypothetical protein POM88_007845 [Heracleum sosnowskyi]|uniref:F-box associated beta-propeller type 3 domain-containing protein n=1 Tax=Heracleum sosnowskyi TaxID=360622 RepID=A0AAD8N6N3_9APIA|nr:hypothetical protein POM88_007845 [Heracleum sosnowskyi]
MREFAPYNVDDSSVHIDSVVVPLCFVSSPVVSTCNGIICLIVSLVLQYVMALVSFDFHKEVLGLVLFPKSIKRKRSNVLDYEGSVAMVFQSVGDGRGAGVDLWTLDDVSGKTS